MELTEVEKAWLIALEDYGLIYLARDEDNNALAAYLDPPICKNKCWQCCGYPKFKFINEKRFNFINTDTVYKICRNSSEELELIALKGERS